MEKQLITKISPKDYENVEPRANALPFERFCQKVERALQKKEPLEKVRDFFDKELSVSLQPGPASLFPILKMMFPGEVIRTYNVQAYSLAQLYISSLNIPKGGKDAKRLLHYRDPNFNSRHFTGDFGKTLEDVLEDRISSTPSSWTLAKIDHTLTQLSQVNAEQRRTMFQDVVHNLCPVEHRFLVCIMLDELRLGFGIHAVLKIFKDKLVMQRYEMSQNLRRVCAELALHHKVDVPRLELLQPFQVQLSARVSSLKNALTRMKGASFVMDRKVDGERYVLHKQDSTIKLFSRTCREPSAGYYQKMHNTLLEQIRVEECILDGEVVAWDEALGRHARFGTNRTAAAATDFDGTLMFVAFDVVYVGGEGGRAILEEMGWGGGVEIHTMPLEQRLQVLRRVLSPLPHRVEIVEHVVVDRSLDEGMRLEQLTQYFKEAIEENWEGLVLKSMDGPYPFGSQSRSQGTWVKIKPNHVQMAISELDLIILGMYYGKGGDFAQYLVGLKDDWDEEEGSGGGGGQKYIPISKVCTGLTDEERGELNQQLVRHSISSNTFPSWVVDWKAKKDDIPDKWISPFTSHILEIECSEIIEESSTYPLNVALRFPRIVRVRHDKSIMDITSKRDFLEVQRKGITFQSVDTKTASDTMKHAKRAKYSYGPPPQVMNASSHGTLPPAMLSGDIFRGKNAHVLPGTYIDAVRKTRRTRQDIENLIKKDGGCIIANVTPSVKIDYMIGPSTTSLRVKTIKEQGKYDILSLEWVLDCLNERRLLQPQLHHVLGATPTIRQRLDMDVWGDSFTQEITNDHLMALLESIPSSSFSQKLSPLRLDDLMDDSFGGRVFYVVKDEQERHVYGDAEVVGLPRRVPFSTLDVAEMTLRVYGGRISSNLGDNVTTLVTTTSRTTSSSGGQGSQLETVDEAWIARHVDYATIDTCKMQSAAASRVERPVVYGDDDDSLVL